MNLGHSLKVGPDPPVAKAFTAAMMWPFGAHAAAVHGSVKEPVGVARHSGGSMRGASGSKGVEDPQMQ